MVWSKLTGRGVTSEVRAYIETMLMLSLADGEVEDSEIQDLAVTIARHPRMRDLGDRQVVDTLMKAWDEIEKQGMARRMREIASVLNYDQRIDAIGMAMSIAASDGEIEPEEMNVLQKLQQAFSLTEGDVEIAMNRYR